MKLTIYSLKGIDFEGEVEALNIKTQSGEITVLDNHRPLITLLKRGKAKIAKRDGSITTKEINSGFLDVMPGSRVEALVN
jgi:F0F1-type ATP synthase epsilon subunit